MAANLFIVVLWVVCVVLTLSILFEVSFAVVLGWFTGACERSGAAQQFQKSTLGLIGGGMQSALTLTLLPPLAPHAGKVHNRLQHLNLLERRLIDSQNQQHIVDSVRDHVERRCSHCAVIRAKGVVDIDATHYASIYRLCHMDDEQVKKMDLVYLRPRTTINVPHQHDGQTTFEVALDLSGQNRDSTHRLVLVGARHIRLGEGAYIDHTTPTIYQNRSDCHVAVLRTYL